MHGDLGRTAAKYVEIAIATRLRQEGRARLSLARARRIYLRAEITVNPGQAQAGFKFSQRTYRQEYVRYISVVRVNDDNKRLLRFGRSARDNDISGVGALLAFSLIPVSKKTATLERGPMVEACFMASLSFSLSLTDD